MISEAVLCYPTTTAAEAGAETGISVGHHPSQLYHDVMEASFGGGAPGSTEPQLRSLLYSLSILKQKVDEAESLVSIILTQESPHQPTHTHSAVSFASVGTLVQELVVTASSLMFNCQQMSLGSPQIGNNNSNNNTFANNNNNNNERYYNNWYSDTGATAPCSSNYISNYTASTTTTTTTTTTNVAARPRGSSKKTSKTKTKTISLSEAYDLVEPEAEDLVAKYTHYCQICGKGFKRDANLRMHMRAHGDEYKSSAALSNPSKKEAEDETGFPRKYSCPQQGCRWNKNHVKFQPLKSIVCVKNHYKRSHCPKMYVCKRCNRKQFSVLSDLRTHEKHCGDRKWQCSCGTTFSRKDKLMGHVALFVGHYPVVDPLVDNKLDFHGELQIQF